VARRPPFTEYLAATDALFVDPADPDAIAAAMAEALATDTRARLRAAGQVRVVAHSWRACAERNLNTYAACARTRQEPMHA
jgi:glycosyltransferase involved in cell wall biosynthesis